MVEDKCAKTDNEKLLWKILKENENPKEGKLSKKAHVWVTLGKGEKKTRVKALLDTGNTIREETAITEELHNRLDVGFEVMGGTPIGTANKDGPKLHKCGVSKPIQMEIQGINGKFLVKPAVVSTLSDQFNIGNGFLESIGKQIPVSVEFHNGQAMLKIGKMETELIRQMSKEEQTGKEQVNQEDHGKGQGSQDDQDQPKGTPAVERQGSREKKKNAENGQRPREHGPLRRQQVYATKEVICDANSLTFVEVQTEKPVAEGMELLVENDEVNQMETIEALYRWRKIGNRIAVMNNAQMDVKILKNSSLGFISPIEVDQEENERQTQSYLEKINSISDEHRCQVVEDLGLQRNPLLKENPEIQKKAIALVMEYADIFGEKGKKEVGVTEMVEFDIKLKEGARPVKQKIRPLNPHQKESLKKQMETWKKEDIIEESISPWGSPMVPAKKAGGAPGEIRWAIDYRALNSVTIADSYPIPNIDEVLERLAGSKFYSALDAAAAYHTIPVEKNSRPLLAFLTPMGLYQFSRMPFGPKNSGAVYARFVDMILQKIRSPNVVAYIDDILVFTKNLENHLKELKSVFEAHRIAGIMLRSKKTKLFTEETKYLGFDVSSKGIKMRRSYVEKILDWPRPTSTAQLRTFLGFTSYYRSFIKDYSNLTNEMNGMRMGKNLEWSDEIDWKFKELKKRFEQMPLRSYPRYDIDEPFRVTTDWSQKNMAGVLSQIQEGMERFIAAHGRKCSKYEANYPSTKGELGSIMSCLRKWDHILKYRKFLLFTDSKALKYIQTLKQPSGIWFRWLQELQSYDFEVIHKPGKENTNADSLSRCDHLPEPTEEEAKEAADEYVGRLCSMCEEEYIKTLYRYIQELDDEDRIIEIAEAESKGIKEMHDFGRDVTPEHVIRAQKEDPIVAEVRSWVQEKRQPDKEELKGKEEELKHYAQVADALEIQDDILYYPYKLNHLGGKKSYRMVMPKEIRNSVFYWSHQSATAGHFGQTATVLRAQSKFYYPGMSQDLKRRVENCGDCLVKKGKVKLRDGPHKPQKTGYPGQRIYVDLIGPLPETGKMERYILSVEDGFTRHANAYPIPNKEAATVARVLIDEYCSDFGFPVGIHSDNGREFVNQIWEQLCDRLGIKKTTTPTYNPQSNIVERWHRTLNMMMKTFMERDEKEWSRYLPAMVMAYNTKVNSSTGMTPYFATFGREARLPVDLILPLPGEEAKTLNSHVEETLKRFNRIYAFMRKNNEAIIRRNAKIYSGKKHDYETDEKVWYLCPRKVDKKPAKLTDQWIGPYKVIKRIAEVLYRIKPADYEGPNIVVHAARLLPYRPGTTVKSRIPANLQTNDQGDELAEEIRPPNQIDEEPDMKTGVPVRLVMPEFDIVDLMAGRKRGRAPRQQTASNQTEPDQASQSENTNEPQPGPSQAPDDVSRKRERTACSDNKTDAEMPEAKSGRILRPKRTRDQLMKQFEEFRRRNEVETGTETDQPEPKRQTMAKEPEVAKKPNIFKKAKDFLFSSDDEMMNTIRTLQVDIIEGSAKPEKGTPGSACYDLTAHNAAVVPAHGISMVPLNIRMAIPPGYFLLLLSRSGLAVKGIVTLGGVIDSDYRGPVCAILANSSDEDFVIKQGQRCTQGVFLPTHDVEFKRVDKLDKTERTGGFGSTGDQGADVLGEV